MDRELLKGIFLLAVIPFFIGIMPAVLLTAGGVDDAEASGMGCFAGANMAVLWILLVLLREPGKDSSK